MLRQAEEIEALKAIYGDEMVQVIELKGSPGCCKVDLHLGGEDGIPSEDGVRLSVFLIPAYPGADMPIFELKGINWRKFAQDHIYQGMYVRRHRGRE